MNSTYYRLYEAGVLALANTLVVKSLGSAQAMNTELRNYGVTVDDDNPRTWKYYLNLAGEYHRIDQAMTVTSLDTQETISFDKATLRRHSATWSNYQPGSDYYKALVDRYPAQEQLILGILNPVDLDTAITAPDYTVLSYDPQYVEPQETNLLRELQARIHHYSVRYHVKGFAVVDDLYLATHLGIMYAMIPVWILNIRLNNCRTRFAHSYHIRQYLASHNRLDRYMDYLTTGQMLWLYRNLLHLENNAGQQTTFDWLVDHIITARDLPLGEYRLYHNTETMPKALRPDIEIRRQAVNRHFSAGTQENFTLREILDDEQSLARGNADVQSQTEVETTQRFTRSGISQLPTKILDCSILDTSQSGVISETDILLNHWLAWADNGLLAAVASIRHPRSGDLLQVPLREAYVLYLYAYHEALGIHLTNVPVVLAKQVRRSPIPTIEELRRLVDTTLVNEDDLIEMVGDHPVIRRMVSIDQFQQYCRTIYDRARSLRYQYVRQEHYYKRGLLFGASEHFYVDKRIDLRHGNEPRNIVTWCQQKGYNVTDLTRLEYELLATTLVETITGKQLDGSAGQLEEMQRAMLNIASQLSSYSIQFIQNINRGPIYYFDDPSLRVGDINVSATETFNFDIVGPGVLAWDAQGHQGAYLDVGSGTAYTLDRRHHASGSMDPTLDITLLSRPIERYQTTINHVVFDMSDDGADFTHTSPTPYDL